MPVIMVARRHPTSLLLTLPAELANEIASHLNATLERPMDDLRSLWVTCLSMRCICDNPTIQSTRGTGVV